MHIISSFLGVHVIIVGVEELLALVVLPYLLPDVRSTPDSEKVLYFTNVSSNPPSHR